MQAVLEDSMRGRNPTTGRSSRCSFAATVFAFVALLHAGVAVFASDSASEEPKTKFNPSWAADACRGHVFGDPSDLRGVGLEGIAIATTVFDSCGMEIHVELIKRGDLKPTVSVITPMGESFWGQLAKIQEESPDIELEEACARIKVRSYSPDTIDSLKLEELVHDFRRIRINPTIDGPIVVHGNIYHVWVYSVGNHAQFRFLGIPGDPEPQNPLQRWTDKLIRLLGLECPVSASEEQE